MYYDSKRMFNYSICNVSIYHVNMTIKLNHIINYTKLNMIVFKFIYLEEVMFKFYHILWKLLSYIVFAKSLICIISNEVWHIVMRYITNSRHKTFCDKTEEVAAAYYLGWINICPSFHPLAKVWYSIYTLQRFTYMLVPNSNGWRKALVVNIRHMDLPSVTFITLHLEKNSMK